jgi:sec-independent protein translocase protein TatA
MKSVSDTNLDTSEPMETERQKLEMIAKSLGVNYKEKSDDELRKIIADKMGQKKTDSSENKV